MAVTRLAQITLVVDDYDKAIDFYTQVLGFKLIEDTKMSDVKRWVVIQPQGSDGCCLLLAKAANEEQKSRVGNQTGGRVFLFLNTNNLQADYDKLKANGVKIVREPSTEKFGKVLVFQDLYGNLIDMIEPS